MKNRLVLKDAFKRYTLDQDKVQPPEETVARFKDKLKRLDLDILEQTMRIDNGRLDIPVYFSLCGKDAQAIIGTRKQMGKGATPAQAEASAVMELAERFSFFSFCRTPKNFFTDTFRNVGDQALAFERIAQSVHDTSPDLPIARKIFENLPLRWTQGFNLTQNQPVLVPFNWFFAINEFNGPCVGNCVEEALCQGICEVVERHVSSVVSQTRLKVPAIRPDSATQPAVVEMIRKYRSAGIRLFLSDFSLNTGIPTVGALAYDPSTFPEKSEIVWTAGTTPDPQKALSRALTEVAQLAGDFNSNTNYVASGLPKYKTIDDADFIANPDKTQDIMDLPDLSDNNIKTEVENCISALARIGMEVIVVDTKHPMLEIPSFYTIIPGAQFRERSLGTSLGMFSAKLIAEGFPPEAAAKRLLEMDKALPGKYYIQFYAGSCLLAMGDPETALSHYRKAVELEPTAQDAASIYSYMGQCLKELGRHREAIDILKSGERFDEDRIDILNLMGFCYFKLQEHENAIACFRKIITIDPTSAIDYANMASNYRDLGKTDTAARYYEMALELDPGIDFARENLARLKKDRWVERW